MSNDLLSMGSQSKPLVLSVEEYAQWKRRMTQFLNHKNLDYMKSIIAGLVDPVLTVPGQVATDTSPVIPVRYVPKPYQYYREGEKELAKIDEEALIYLTMAISNDIYNRVDSRESAKAMWDELERQFQGTERSIQDKLNQSINAYEGFHAKEGEALIDTYNRFNVIMNDRRRNRMNKSISEINYKFIKNLNPEWKSYAINRQMTKNMAQEDVNDMFSTLSQHEDEVKLLNEEKKIVKDSLALLAERKKDSSSKSVSTSKSKIKKSKAFLAELSQSSSESSSSDEAELHSNDDIQRFAENLALITKQFNKSFGKKKYSSKPKYEGYRKERPEKPRFGKRKEKTRRKRRNKKRLSQNLVCMMANVNEHAEASSDQSDGDSENMEKEFESLKGKLSYERQTMLSFRDENALLKVVIEDKESEKDALKKEKEVLKAKILELERDLVNLNSEKGEFKIKFEACSQERNEAYCKIKQLEDLNLKRGQTEQTLNLLTNILQDVKFYNAKTGLGLTENDVLKKAPENLYHFEKLGSKAKKIPDICDTFVKAETPKSETSCKGKEVIDDDTSSCADSQTSFKSVGFQYNDLNKSYKNRKLEFVEFESLFCIQSSTESANDDKSIPETECKYDEYESGTDVCAQIPLLESVTSESSSEVKIEECSNVMNSIIQKEFVNKMTEEIFDGMINSSDLVPILKKLDSDSVIDQTSNFEKQIKDLQNTLEELEDENCDLRFKLDKSFEENKKLSKELNDLKKQFHDLNVKMIWKWIPKRRYEWRVKSKACHLWFVDSGCSRHMTGFMHLLHDYVEEPVGTVSFANSKLHGIIRGYGSLKNDTITIKKVLYVDGLDHNLFNTSHFCDSQYQVWFTINHCFIEDLDGYEIFRAERYQNLYAVNFPTLLTTRPVCLLAKASKAQSWTWHWHLSHQNFKVIDKLARQGIVKGLPEMRFEKDSLCPTCHIGKMKRSSHKAKTKIFLLNTSGTNSYGSLWPYAYSIY
ncbi:hypothetical protein L6452_40321 [Arctium lappa]|uniref:Uncharacterized protein n=1 Tax=Arctium lappa TaxID=4217 RepID=A0ACB8XL34_ARCLA|nr:hypothetical protein L6452_40321 [Arctium lappa]